MGTRNYDREFTLNAVNYYRENQKPTRQICKELSIPVSTFSVRIQEFEFHRKESFPGSGHLNP